MFQYDFFVASFLLFQAFFAISIFTKKMFVIDMAWGLGFLVIALTEFPYKSFTGAHILYFSLVVLWAVRLASYMFVRIKGKKEDPRYEKLASEWKGNLQLNLYLRVYLVQWVLLNIVGIQIVTILNNRSLELNPFVLLGAFLALIGLIIETVADWQLYNFKKSGQKGVMKYGIWQYSRHPNYFGESLFWWSMFIFSIPFGIWPAIVSPIFLTFLLLKVSGIPMLEERYANNPEYQEYAKKTSSFIPMPPKKDLE